MKVNSASVLRELHRIHQQLRDLRERLDRGPRQIRARSTNVARLEEELKQTRAEVKHARVAADQKQLLLKSGESKIQDLKTKLNQASSNREYQALKDQIAADEMANSVLADEILEALEKIDQFGTIISEAEHRLAKAQAELAKIEQETREQEAALLVDVRRLEVQSKEVEQALPADFAEVYMRVVKSKGSDAMAQVEADICSGCFQNVTPNMQNSLAMGRIVLCQSCGRLLYLPEDRSPSRGR